MSNTRTVKSYHGTALLTHSRITWPSVAPKAIRDASDDYMATFTLDTLLVHGKSERECIEQLASELQSMATALMFNARRLKMSNSA
jgi:hypothetical protein